MRLHWPNATQSKPNQTNPNLPNQIWVEPIVLKGLSMVFPTIRIWPDSTSSVVIEWLHETLQLFGLQQQVRTTMYAKVAANLALCVDCDSLQPQVMYA